MYMHIYDDNLKCCDKLFKITVSIINFFTCTRNCASPLNSFTPYSWQPFVFIVIWVLSHVPLFVTLWTATSQASLSFTVSMLFLKMWKISIRAEIQTQASDSRACIVNHPTNSLGLWKKIMSNKSLLYRVKSKRENQISVLMHIYGI